MRTYKQHFTMSFNGRRDHHGTMFEGRYHERHHKPEPHVMWQTSAYIDVNARKAGLVKRPEDYEWCSFAAAVKGGENARQHGVEVYPNYCVDLLDEHSTNMPLFGHEGRGVNK